MTGMGAVFGGFFAALRMTESFYISNVGNAFMHSWERSNPFPTFIYENPGINDQLIPGFP